MDNPDIDISDGDAAKVFLSYSRKDREAARRIADVLRERHFGVFKDTDDILPTEEWKGRLETLIAEADTIVFLLSPHSAASEVCAWEVEYAASLNKRIAPIVIDEVDTAAIPPILARLNFIFCTERDPFQDAVDTLVSALNTDIDWIREHTRLAGLSRRWDVAGRPSRLLLRGQDIADAEAWRDGHPADAPVVTGLQAAFVSDSRRAAGRRLRFWIAGSAAVAAATAALAVVAWLQSQEATLQRDTADRERVRAEEQRDLAEQRRITVLERIASDQLRRGDRAEGLSALVEAGSGSAATIRALQAGLRPGGEIIEDRTPGTPFVLNGRLFVNGAAGSPPVAIDNFTARWFEVLGETLVLIGATGTMRIYDPVTGTVIAEQNPDRVITPCFADRGKPDEFRVFGFYIHGSSVCSMSYTDWTVIPSGFDVRESWNVCSGEPITFNAAGTEPFFADAEATLPICVAGAVKSEAAGAEIPQIPGLGVLNQIPEYSFPQARPEEALWSRAQPPGPDDLAPVARELLGAEYPIPPDQAERLGMNELEGEEVPQFVLPRFWRSDRLAAVMGVSVWGMGGQESVFCAGPHQAIQGCVDISTYGGTRGANVRFAAGQEALVLYGTDLSLGYNLADEAPVFGTHNLYFMQAGASFEIWPQGEVDRFGAIFDADFSPDGARIALLTQSALVVLEPDKAGGTVVETLSIPAGAVSMDWLADGSMAVLTAPGTLYLRGPGQPFNLFDRSGVVPGWSEDKADAFGPYWLAESTAGDLLAVGAGSVVQIYDRALLAPVSGPADLGDRRVLLSPGSKPDVIRNDDGSIEIRHVAQRFIRRGPDGSVPTAAYVTPDAPLAP